MNSSSSEELKIPVLENTYGPRKPSKRDPLTEFFLAAGLIATGALIYICFIYPVMAEKKNFTSYKPVIRLDSLIYCPTNTSNHLVIWDLKLDIANTNNYSGLCIDPFEVSIFSSYNRNKLLKKTALAQRCVDPRNHTSASVFADASLMDPNDLLDRTNGTVTFDLKIHGHIWFRYLPYRADYGGDLVCRNAKVALSTSCNSSCASMVRDPFMCSYVQ